MRRPLCEVGRMKKLVTLLLSAVFLVSAAPSGRTVLMIVHVPLTYENGRHVSASMLADIHRSLGALGPMLDHRGNGSWISLSGQFMLDRNDDVFVTTTLRQARSFLPKFLPGLRKELDQDSVLSEIVTGVAPIAGEEARTQVEVDVPDADAVAVAHALAVDAGGSSQYSVGQTEHLSVDALAAVLPRLRTTLKRLHYRWTERPVLFILVAR